MAPGCVVGYSYIGHKRRSRKFAPLEWLATCLSHGLAIAEPRPDYPEVQWSMSFCFLFPE
jgi:hypothetical protein